MWKVDFCAPFPLDVLAKKVMQLHQKAVVYRGIMNRAKAVSLSYERLMHSHQGESGCVRKGGRRMSIVGG